MTQRISLVRQGSITTVDVHNASADESIFDDNPNLAMRIIREDNGSGVRLVLTGADLSLSNADWIFFMEQLNSLVREME